MLYRTTRSQILLASLPQGNSPGNILLIAQQTYRYQCKRQLHTLQYIDPLVEDVQLGILVSEGQCYQQRRTNGSRPGDSNAPPLGDFQVQETPHDKLPTVGAGHCAGLACC